jgi:hypothetical protein
VIRAGIRASPWFSRSLAATGAIRFERAQMVLGLLDSWDLCC